MTTALDRTALTGITTAEAERRLAVDGPNELPTAERRNLVQQAWDVLREPMLLLLLGVGTMAPSEWLIAFVAGFLGVAWFEAHKARAHRAAQPGPRPASAGSAGADRPDDLPRP